MRRVTALGFVLALAAVSGCRAAGPTSLLPPLSKQIEVREGWIGQRHAALLAQMRRHAIGMLLIVTEEFHPDPLVEYLITPRPLVGNRELFAFVDGGDAGLIRHALSSEDESLARLFTTIDSPRRATEVLATLVERWRPGTIALAIGGRRGPGRSLGHDSYVFIADALGSETMARVVSAEPLLEEVLDTRLEGERLYFEALLQLTDSLARRALSAEVITPGVTTVGDVRRWLIDEADAHRAGVWFQPDLRVQRRGVPLAVSGDFPATAGEGAVIGRGDLLHLDFGLVAMGLSTDWQRLAYVLLPGEALPPAGLRRGLAETNLAQQALCRAARPGTAAGAVHDDAMAELAGRGIAAMIYSHALGAHGHALGPTIDFRAARRADLDSRSRPLRAGSYLAVELSTRRAVEEWDGQEVFFGEEDPAWLAEDGYRFFRPVQDSIYLIR